MALASGIRRGDFQSGLTQDVETRTPFEEIHAAADDEGSPTAVYVHAAVLCYADARPFDKPCGNFCTVGRGPIRNFGLGGDQKWTERARDSVLGHCDCEVIPGFGES